MEALTAYLARVGKTPAELARELGCGLTVVYYWKNGERQPSPAMARRLSAHTGIPLFRIRPDIWPRKQS